MEEQPRGIAYVLRCWRCGMRTSEVVMREPEDYRGLCRSCCGPGATEKDIGQEIERMAVECELASSAIREARLERDTARVALTRTCADVTRLREELAQSRAEVASLTAERDALRGLAEGMASALEVYDLASHAADYRHAYPLARP